MISQLSAQLVAKQNEIHALLTSFRAKNQELRASDEKLEAARQEIRTLTVHSQQPKVVFESTKGPLEHRIEQLSAEAKEKDEALSKAEKQISELQQTISNLSQKHQSELLAIKMEHDPRLAQMHTDFTSLMHAMEIATDAKADLEQEIEDLEQRLTEAEESCKISDNK